MVKGFCVSLQINLVVKVGENTIYKGKGKNNIPCFLFLLKQDLENLSGNKNILHLHQMFHEVKRGKGSQAQWLIFVITACRRLRRENCSEFEINLGNLERESVRGRDREVDRQRHTERESSIPPFLFLSWVSPRDRRYMPKSLSELEVGRLDKTEFMVVEGQLCIEELSMN